MVIKTKQLGIALQWDGARPFAEEEDDTLAKGWPQCTHEMGVCHNSAQSAVHIAHCTVQSGHSAQIRWGVLGLWDTPAGGTTAATLLGPHSHQS